MAHELYQLSNGKHSMAYVGELPWHGLGQKLTEGTPIETWQKEAGLAYNLVERPVLYLNHANLLEQYAGKKILTRDDNGNALSLVGEDYQVVQPKQVLEFYRDLIKAGGMELHTAGSLLGGRKYWALAKMKESALVMKDDGLEAYLLLATSCDCSLATTGMFTSIAVVCANTLRFAVQEGESGKSRRYVKVPHNAKFDADAMKAELGLVHGSWEVFVENVAKLVKKKVRREEAQEILVDAVAGEFPVDEIATVSEEEWRAAQADKKFVQGILQLFEGNMIGFDLKSRKGTAWGLVNATTQYCDHQRNTRTADMRLQRAWFGDSAVIKERVFERCLEI